MSPAIHITVQVGKNVGENCMNNVQSLKNTITMWNTHGLL